MKAATRSTTVSQWRFSVWKNGSGTLALIVDARRPVIQEDVGNQPRLHPGLQACLHQAKGRAVGQIRMPHNVRLHQRLPRQRLERILELLHVGT